MKKQFLVLAIVIFSFTQVLAQQENVLKIDSKHFKNLFQVSDSVYRSEQPSKKGFHELEAMGIKTIINLRRLKEDSKKAKGTALQLKKIPLRSAEMDEAAIIKVLSLIQASKKPVLVHCWHGSDRTGAIIAAYRVVFEGWAKEDAIQELRNPDFGYHENWYPNLMDLIASLDLEKIRKELGIQ